MSFDLRHIAFAATLLIAAPAGAVTVVVDSEGGPLTVPDCSQPDSGTCTLAEAINTINGIDGVEAEMPPHHIINFADGLTLSLSANLPAITEPVQIVGPVTIDCANGFGQAFSAFNFSGVASTSYAVTDMTLNSCETGNEAGGAAIRFLPSGPSTLTASGLTITGATATNASSRGGAIRIGSGHTAVLSNLDIDGAQAGSVGGAIANEGNLTLTDSRIANASLSGSGAGAAIASNLNTGDGGTVIERVEFDGNDAGTGNNGGAIFATVTVTGTEFRITDSIFNNNTATNGGALSVGFGNVEVTGSTFSNNSATTSGGAIFLDRQDSNGTLRNGSVTVANATFSGNSAETGGAISASNENTTGSSVVHSSFVGNTASNTGAALGFAESNTTNILPGSAQDPFYKNLFVANSVGAGLQSCAFPVNHTSTTAAGSNLSDDETCGFVQATDLQGVAMPGVDLTLADNNPPTLSPTLRTHRLLAGSPAIDGGADALDNGTDQRKAPTADGDDNGSPIRDIGAYEFAGYSAIEFNTPSPSAVENDSPLVAEIRRFGNLGLPASIDVATVDNGTATAGQDYDSASETLTFEMGDDAIKSFSVTLIDDDVVEGDMPETFEIALDNAANPEVDLGAAQPAGASIVDFEEGTFAFDAATYSTTEGQAFNVTITRTDGADGPVTLLLNSSESGGNPATADTDYPTVTDQMVAFAYGETTKDVAVTITDDDAYEPEDETFSLTVSLAADAPANAAIGSPATTEVTIISDDPAEVGSFQFRATDADATVNESNGTVELGITRTNGTDCGVDVVYSTMDGTATAGEDYTARTEQTVTFADGDDATKTFQISITDDDQGESDETFSVNLISATPQNCEDGAQATLGDPGTATVTIASDEAVGVQFAEASWLVNEREDAVTIVVEVLNPVTGSDIRVDYATSERTDADAATANSDYTTTSGTLVWTSGESGAKTFDVPIINDDGPAEPDERFDVSITIAQGNAEIVGPNPTPVTIIEQKSVRLAAETFTSPAENGESVTVMVERIGGLSGSASVDVAATATDGANAAEPGTDFDDTTRSVTWADGEGGTKTVAFPIISDALVEGDEVFTVQLTNATGADIVSPQQATGVITDDDSTVVMSLEMVATAENAGMVEISAVRSGPTIAGISVPVMTVDGTAVAGDDYTALAGDASFDWAAGESGAKTLSVPILDNNDVDGDQNFSVILPADNTDPNVTIGAPAATQVTINDDETQLRFANASQTTAEDSGTVLLSVQRRGVGDGAVTVQYTVTGGTASNGSDYSLSGGTLNWADGDTTDKTITATILEDARAEDSETFEVTLSNSTSTGEPTPVGTPATTTVTITDNDTPGLAVIQSDGTTIVREGGPNDDLNIRLNSQPSNDVTVRFDTPSRVRVVTSNPADNQLLVFTSANWNQPQAVDVVAVDDSAQQSEVTQSLIVRTTSSDSRYDDLTQSVSVTVRDNDAGGGGGGGSSGATTPAMLLTLGGLLLLRRRQARG